MSIKFYSEFNIDTQENEWVAINEETGKREFKSFKPRVFDHEKADWVNEILLRL